MADNKERTYLMIKPDGVHRGLIGEIIKRFEQKGFQLVALKFLQVSDKPNWMCLIHDMALGQRTPGHSRTVGATLRRFVRTTFLPWFGEIHVVRTGGCHGLAGHQRRQNWSQNAGWNQSGWLSTGNHSWWFLHRSWQVTPRPC